MPPRVRPPLHRARTTGSQDPKRPAGDAGFTLIEALVSFVLLAVVSAAAITAVVNATTTSKNSTDRSAAADLAQSDQQAAQALRYPNYPAAIGAKTITVGNTPYTVTRTIGSACPSTPNYDTNPYMTVTSTVTWPPAGTSQRVVMTQELAC